MDRFFKITDRIYDEMERLQSKLDQEFLDLFRIGHPYKMYEEAKWKPYTDMVETEDAFWIKIELAGLKKEDFTVTIDANQIIVKGTRRSEWDPPPLRYHQLEINYDAFERRIILPFQIKRENIYAKYQDGFLYIEVKKPEKTIEVVVEGREIPISREE